MTPTLARRCIPTSLFSASPSSGRKSRQPNHELMALYLCLHTLPPSTVSRIPGLDLEHRTYIEHLPGAATMRTTLYFSPRERELLRGSNLHGATDEREQGWRDEWDEVRGWLQDEKVRSELGWDKWLWACTILSCVGVRFLSLSTL